MTSRVTFRKNKFMRRFCRLIKVLEIDNTIRIMKGVVLIIPRVMKLPAEFDQLALYEKKEKYALI